MIKLLQTYTSSSEVLAVFGVADGDAVYMTPSDHSGLNISAHDPAVREASEAAEVVADENCTLPQELSAIMHYFSGIALLFLRLLTILKLNLFRVSV